MVDDRMKWVLYLVLTFNDGTVKPYYGIAEFPTEARCAASADHLHSRYESWPEIAGIATECVPLPDGRLPSMETAPRAKLLRTDI